MTTKTAAGPDVGSTSTTHGGDAGRDSSETTHGRQAIGPEILESLFGATLERRRPVDETTSSGEPSRAGLSSDKRHAASVIAKDPRLVLGILSFIHAQGPLDADELISYGPSGRLFEIVFDLYDAGMLVRSDGVVSVAPFGLKVLSRANLA